MATASTASMAPGRTTPAPPRKMYVLRNEPADAWLEVLAGTDPALRSPADGKPMITLISRAAGLDPSALTQIKNGSARLGATVMGALTGFAMTRHGLTRARAEDCLYDLVDEAPASRERVAA